MEYVAISLHRSRRAESRSVRSEAVERVAGWSSDVEDSDARRYGRGVVTRLGYNRAAESVYLDVILVRIRVL